MEPKEFVHEHISLEATGYSADVLHTSLSDSDRLYDILLLFVFRNNSNRRYSGVSAFDYVTHRIVEVMRSDADGERHGERLGERHERGKPQPLTFPSASYPYPYSALNVAQPQGDSTYSALLLHIHITHTIWHVLFTI